MFKRCYTCNFPHMSSPCGSPDKVEFGYDYSGDGEKKLVPVGKINMYERTQISKPDDIYTLLKNCGVNPSDSDLISDAKTTIDTILDDFSSMPRSLIEAHDVIHRVQDSFDRLPVDVKAKFNNSSSIYLNSFVDGSINDRLSEFGVKKEEVIKDE